MLVLSWQLLVEIAKWHHLVRNPSAAALLSPVSVLVKILGQSSLTKDETEDLIEVVFWTVPNYRQGLTTGCGQMDVLVAWKGGTTNAVYFFRGRLSE